MINTKEPIIQVTNLGKAVQTSEGVLNILTAIDLTVQPGETIAIVGASGSGKSTLIGLLAGLDLPSQGEIILAGTSLTDLDEDGRAILRGKYVGFVFQSFQLLPSLTALENVMLPLELAAHQAPEDAAKKLLDRVGLAERITHDPSHLSGGEQQRVALARAFATQPKILFADEPTGNLDSHTGDLVIDLMFELNQEKQTTLILVTHDEHLASRCDRSIQLEAGRIV
ncbi:MAG: ABC transporter ATP-binding protein [Methylococcales bacterium]